MTFIVFKSVLQSLLTLISLILCFISTTADEPRAAVSPVLDCKLDNETYICTGAQYRMYCNTTMHRFYLQRYQNQYQYHCMSNDCICVGNKDTCACYYNTTSCFCEIFSNSITVPTAVRPVLDCELNNDTYICIGAQYHMYCNTSLHYFSYNKYQYQSQYQYRCWSSNCDCHFNKDSCRCYNHTSSCFCTNHSYSIALSSSRNPVTIPHCLLYNDTYICTGAQYRMYCNTKLHNFSYQSNQNQYQCSNNCDCRGNMDTCTTYSSNLPSCFCENDGNNITIPTAVSPVTDPDCVLYNDTYICTGAQYRMYCNTRMHYFSYQRYQYQDQYQCVNNNCNCIGNKDTCTCYSSTLSSCFCETYGNSIALTTEVSPAYGCVLYNDTYICTGAQYRMYCNTRMHSFNYQTYQYQCWNNNRTCIGNKDTCTCSSSTLSSCFCETYGNSIALARQVSPAYGCVLYNDTYICTGAQYRMYCNTRMHDFYCRRYQNQNQCEYRCWNNNCDCRGNKDTCMCYSNTLSSCFCETYGNSIIIPTAVNPLRVSQCELYNDTYICTGAQYRMYCNTRMHDFYYQRSRYQDQYQCVNNNCNCIGNQDTCTCSGSTLSSCFCETYGNSIALSRQVSPAYGCVLYNDTYICTGARYRMYCNITVHYFSYWRYQNHNQNQNPYQCWNNCDCRGNVDTCMCSSSSLSSCFCTNYNNTITIPAAVSPVTGPDCVLYNDTYICTGAQYRMYCNTRMHDFSYQRYQYQDQYQCVNNNCNCVAVSPVYDCVLYNDTSYICTGAQYHMHCNTAVHDLYYSRNEHRCTSNTSYCRGNKETCTCNYSTSSSCFCTNYGNTIPAAVSPVYDCVLYTDTYICTGSQYRMYCNTRMHSFNYQRYRYQNQYQCVNNNCDCRGNKDTCTCSSRTFSSCFCEYNISTPTTISPTTAVLNITLPNQCMSQTSEGCLQNLLDQIENITAQVLPVTTVMSILTVAFNASETILESSSLSNPTELASYGNRMLKTSEKLISTLVKPTDTSDNVSFTLPTVEGQVFMVGPQVTLDKIPQLDTKNSSVDIDLIGIAKNNIGSAAVAFMSFNTMENLLKPDFFNTSNNMTKTMMSTVISATLPKTTNTKLTKPVNFTFRHIREFDPSGSLSCVYWNISEWIVDGCSVLKINSSYTVCSCVHLSTFALIMQTSRPPESDPLLELLNLVCVIVGLVFFTLALLTFALCQWSPGVNNVARINICISLLLAHLLFLLTQRFLSLIQPQQVLCGVIAGLLHFLFLSGFVWMFIEAVLLFICVKNLSQISSKKREVLRNGFLCVIGYVVSLVVVCVSVGLVPEGYGNEHCWIKLEKGFIWSFLGPVCVILALNIIIFVKIIITLNSTLKNLNAEISQMKQTNIMVFKTLAQCVVLGCPWILGFFTNGSKVLEILFLILNSQQGTFIFLIYCVLNHEVRQQYRKFFRCLYCEHKKH
ncbi:uncharacterized protein LOC131542343 isoform X2 [Onychostoma macrolepis]|uniref:uncharacterized protein LOC131542343 isoform X2 n=1 Tax=Onychostoma macrolepis TaxID=369639 RepID=UPI00272C12F1|nr:uncharacterized protein LOC131542343 isoform X2 [Onychostoma macrolepis]